VLIWNLSSDLNPSSPSAISSPATWLHKIRTFSFISNGKDERTLSLHNFKTLKIFTNHILPTKLEKILVPYVFLQNLRTPTALQTNFLLD
jgi:hypothetical protein